MKFATNTALVCQELKQFAEAGGEQHDLTISVQQD